VTGLGNLDTNVALIPYGPPNYNPSGVCHRAGAVVEGAGVDAIGGYEAIVR